MASLGICLKYNRAAQQSTSWNVIHYRMLKLNNKCATSPRHRSWTACDWAGWLLHHCLAPLACLLLFLWLRGLKLIKDTSPILQAQVSSVLNSSQHNLCTSQPASVNFPSIMGHKSLCDVMVVTPSPPANCLSNNVPSASFSRSLQSTDHFPAYPTFTFTFTFMWHLHNWGKGLRTWDYLSWATESVLFYAPPTELDSLSTCVHPCSLLSCALQSITWPCGKPSSQLDKLLSIQGIFTGRPTWRVTGPSTPSTA